MDRYVNPTTGTNDTAPGRGESVGDPWATLAYALSTIGDLTEATVIHCDGGIDAGDIPIINNGNTGGPWTLTIQVDEADRPDFIGELDFTKYTRQAHTGHIYGIQISRSNVVIDGLQIWARRPDNISYGVFISGTPLTDITIRNSFIRIKKDDADTYDNPGADAIHVTTSSNNLVANIENVIVWGDWAVVGATTRFYRGLVHEYATGGQMTYKNCTISNLQSAFTLRNPNLDVYSSAIFNNEADYSCSQNVGTINWLNNATDDDVPNAPNPPDTTADLIQWTGGATDWANNFTDYAAGDFTVVNSGADINDAGHATNSTPTDIIGTTRVTPDIGAFELAAPAGAPIAVILNANEIAK